MNNWNTPQRPAEYAEQSLVTAMLNHSFPPGSPLPGERTLAEQLGVTRPTLREAIQRLARDGWLTVQQGKSTMVNDFWQDGGMNVLSTLVHHRDHLPPDFVTNLLEIRRHLAPAYTRAAVERAPQAIQDRLKTAISLPDNAAAYAAFDWQLHRTLTIHSGNPIYTLILNGFTEFYDQIARKYFATSETRARSRTFYTALKSAIQTHNSPLAEQITRQTMVESIIFWQKMKQNHDAS